MSSLITGLFTVLYTIFVYSKVLLKPDQDWKWIIAIFCLTWTIVYLLKKLMDVNPCKKKRYLGNFVLGTGVISNLAPLAKIQILDLKLQGESTDTFLFFTATCFCAAYFLLIRKTAKELEWSNKASWKFDFIQCFLAVIHLFILYATVTGDRVEISDETERKTFIFHRIILTVMAALAQFDLVAFVMDKLELKENKKRVVLIKYSIDDEGVSTITRVNYAEVFNGEKIVEGKQFSI
ncbi:hypothetical protein CAEBREN_13780 [Caenorhabditis brenneri]|uniref:Uncharacterized protein n=1 Tax=Caenorhabditis brenneri TaxID=135651 RepID=G0MWT3_CAEBE|nr:hypothetical protein CAEBREN_13780 [Caenorhabditis brenneri]